MEVRTAAVCCAVVCMATITICTSNGPVLHCSCPRVSDTKVPVENLWSYTMQKKNIDCRIKAIKFETVKGKILCSDPSSPWAQRAKNYLDMKHLKPKPKPHPTRQTSTVLPKRKRIWLKENTWKKPGLRKKQN